MILIMWLHISFILSLIAFYDLTFSFVFVDLTIKLYFSKSFAIQRSNYTMLLQVELYNNELRILPPLTWHICWIIIDYLGPIVYTYILN